jgi:UDP-N-acetylmuramoyl-tripeptide--D-alanyl-D-alanine ligase
MRFTAAALAEAVGGTLDGPDAALDGVSVDTRTLAVGQLFVPLVATRDGHRFLAEAVAAGAPAYLTTGARADGGASAVVVADTADALLAVGRMARARLGDRVVGITGSVGKTTVKELVAGALSTTFATVASPLSYNNEIGVPLTLANAGESTEATVVEMGARGPGHIATLCAVARPSIAVVTRVGLAHLEQFESLEGVARAKGELVEALPASGTAVLNADDERVAAMAERTGAHVVLFGHAPAAEVRAERVDFDPLARARFQLVAPEGRAEVSLSLHGTHQVANALAAAGAALAAGVGIEAAAAGLSAVGPPRWRMSVHELGPGALLVNDAYNANPTSTRAALESLAAMAGTRRMAVLGAMAELGGASEEGHREVAELAEALGIELVAYRTPAYGLPPADGAPAVIERLGPWRPGDVVLVKGSRAAGMEALVDELLSARRG